VNIERKRPLERQVDADGLIDDVACGHDDHEIDVALLVRLAVGIGAEQDDFVRMKALRDLPRKTPNGRKRDVRRTIAVRLNVGNRSRSFLYHSAIVAAVPSLPKGCK